MMVWKMEDARSFLWWRFSAKIDSYKYDQLTALNNKCTLPNPNPQASLLPGP